jgi:protein-disulfide isomerase
VRVLRFGAERKPMGQPEGRRMPWELLGLVALVVIALVGVVIWRFSPSGRGELVAPSHVTVPANAGLAVGTTEDGRPYFGRPDAPVTVYQISDFQCPFCRMFVQSKMAQLVADYIAPGNARLVFVTVGFDGPESLAAGVAALCANEQGRFWPMHDWLYANQSPLNNGGGFSRDRLLLLAERAGVDTARLARCLDDPEVAARIADNEVFARQQSVDTTPAFVIGDRVVSGGDLPSIESVIADALGR